MPAEFAGVGLIGIICGAAPEDIESGAQFCGAQFWGTQFCGTQFTICGIKAGGEPTTVGTQDGGEPQAGGLTTIGGVPQTGP